MEKTGMAGRRWRGDERVGVGGGAEGEVSRRWRTVSQTGVCRHVWMRRAWPIITPLQGDRLTVTGSSRQPAARRSSRAPPRLRPRCRQSQTAAQKSHRSHSGGGVWGNVGEDGVSQTAPELEGASTCSIQAPDRVELKKTQL